MKGSGLSNHELGRGGSPSAVRFIVLLYGIVGFNLGKTLMGRGIPICLKKRK